MAIYLKRVQQREITAADAELADSGLSLSLWCALRQIGENPGASTHALAERTSLTDQSFSALVTKLADKGLVERTQGAGRMILHQLTDAGAEAMAASTPTLVGVLGKEFGALEPAELTTFVTLLRKISES